MAAAATSGDETRHNWDGVGIEVGCVSGAPQPENKYDWGSVEHQRVVP